MIENEQELRFSVERLVKLYAMRDRSEVEPHWSQEQRGVQVFQDNAMIQKLRHDIVLYLAQQPEENFSSPMLEKYIAQCDQWEREEMEAASNAQLARAA